jgi:hypothetical protein
MIVLAYHSHNISGTDYSSNDHVALAADLETIHGSGARVVSLDRIAAIVRRESEPPKDQLLVGLSFDDGPVFDYADFRHPQFGPQRSFYNILKDFESRHGDSQPELHATSFVIASPAARRAMESSPSCGYPYLPDWLGDGWWKPAMGSGLMGIGNHSWDHVHHAVPELAAASQARDDFSKVATFEAAEREIRTAGEYINSRVGGGCTLFAFPFGHTNDFLVNDYLPRHQDKHGMRAAFGTGGRAITEADPAWNIPRIVCGDHWQSPQELARLVAS